MTQVRLEKIRKEFGLVEAVKEFSLDIEHGEFIVLVGPSGCGKTTLLRIVSGLETATSGDVYIGGQCVTRVPPKKRDIAMVFQNYALYPHMNVFDNLAFCLRLRKMKKPDIRDTVQNTAQLLGIAELLQRKPNQLSGGQRQRVALGRAIVRNPQVFLFDEPLSNLDAKLRVNMRAELLDLHHRLKNTAIYVTHDQLEAMTMGTRIVVMNAGEIQQVDEPKAVYARPANQFVAGFLGSPAINFIDCSLSLEGEDLAVVSAGLHLLVPEERRPRLEAHLDRRVTLGLRPEHIYPGRTADAAARFKALVRLIEPLGSEQLVHLQVEEHTLVARLDPSVDYRVGEVAEFNVRMKAANMFDPATEDAIY